MCIFIGLAARNWFRVKVKIRRIRQYFFKPHFRRGLVIGLISFLARNFENLQDEKKLIETEKRSKTVPVFELLIFIKFYSKLQAVKSVS